MKDLHRFLDILYIQEHKPTKAKIEELCHKLWKSALILSKEASPAYNHKTHATIGVGSSGVCCLASPRISSLVQEYNAIKNIAQWFILRHILGNELGILNVYGFHNLMEHSHL